MILYVLAQETDRRKNGAVGEGWVEDEGFVSPWPFALEVGGGFPWPSHGPSYG